MQLATLSDKISDAGTAGDRQGRKIAISMTVVIGGRIKVSFQALMFFHFRSGVSKSFLYLASRPESLSRLG